jgi:hypothetical protein
VSSADSQQEQVAVGEDGEQEELESLAMPYNKDVII